MPESPQQAIAPHALSPDAAKRLAAAKALELVVPGMRLGLGTGTTAAHFVALLGARVAQGLEVICVPTSERTRTQAELYAIPLATIDALPELDLTVDGADEFDPQLRLIKGGGGALLREKIVAMASKRMIVITDSSKSVAVLGKFPLPVEVNLFGLEVTKRMILAAAKASGCDGEVRLRKNPGGHAFVTDNGHFIVDCHFGAIGDPDGLADRLAKIPGVVEHGLFIGIAKAVISAGPAGLEISGQRD
ncbi:ribose-5-phosphate isomerase RpiA [Methylocapsa sp. D3K7]|uniref:ribose-5-phosphate isomerase RpiA n=1 Tax=Methylocapsa sp. D3K7 TaxID=3041435 RepID=UPI00244E9BF6|nr:ribose-5-phosphate isomerase RpiA [Methylocapsa sp. D3K7]WGJ13387.1 ribose-5-phosphate isomerase RpiA [Methylocapsa sp. D3K7]